MCSGWRSLGSIGDPVGHSTTIPASCRARRKAACRRLSWSVSKREPSSASRRCRFVHTHQRGYGLAMAFHKHAPSSINNPIQQVREVGLRVVRSNSAGRYHAALLFGELLF